MALTKEQQEKVNQILQGSSFGEKQEMTQETTASQQKPASSTDLLAQARLRYQEANKPEEKGFLGKIGEKVLTEGIGSITPSGMFADFVGGYAEPIAEKFKKGFLEQGKKAVESSKDIARRRESGEYGPYRATAEGVANVVQYAGAPIAGLSEAIIPEKTGEYIMDIGEKLNAIPEMILKTGLGKDVAESGASVLESLGDTKAAKDINEATAELMQNYENLDEGTKSSINRWTDALMTALDYAGMGVAKKPAQKAALETAEQVGDFVQGAKRTLQPLQESLPSMQQIKEAIPDPVATMRGWANSREMRAINTEMDDLLKSRVSLDRAIRETPNVRQYLTDPRIFENIKVENGRLNTEAAALLAQDRVDTMLDLTSQIIPEAERIAPSIDRDALREMAIENLRGQRMSLADEAAEIKRLDKQINALPEQLSISQLDDQRARFRTSARNAKGQMKPQSAYSALENASRDLVFDTIEKLPVGQGGEFPAIRQYITDMIKTKDFLENKLSGQTVKGGRLGKYFGRTVGAVAGSPGGALTSIIGSELGGIASDILTNNAFGSRTKLRLFKKLTDDPEAIKIAEKYLQEFGDYQPLALPAPTGSARSQSFGQGTINLPRQSQSSADEAFTPRRVNIEKLDDASEFLQESAIDPIKITDEAINVHGTTNIPESGAYITDKGALIDGSGRLQGNEGIERIVDHREIAQDALMNLDNKYMYNSGEALVDFQKITDNIRYGIDGDQINIELVKMPNDAQMRAIARMSKDKNINLDISNIETGDLIDSQYFSSFNDMKEYLKSTSTLKSPTK